MLSLGDVIDENREHAKSVSAGETYEERGRAFLERLDEQGVPVLAVPGNHGPVDCTQRLSEWLTNVHPLHGVTRNVVVGAEWSLAIAGWGCEQFDFTPALLSPDYPDIPVQDEAQTPDVVASTLLRAAGQYLAGDLSRVNLAHKLGTEATNPSFETSLARLDARFKTLVELVEGANGPTVVASHISPFNVPFDIRGQHSHDGDYHFGSVALRVALAAAGVDACLFGHTHQRGLTAIPTTSGQYIIPVTRGSLAFLSARMEPSGRSKSTSRGDDRKFIKLQAGRTDTFPMITTATYVQLPPIRRFLRESPRLANDR